MVWGFSCGLRFRAHVVQGLELMQVRVQGSFGLGFLMRVRVWGSFGSGFLMRVRVQGSGIRVQGSHGLAASRRTAFSLSTFNYKPF